MLEIAVSQGSIPSEYLQYYYFTGRGAGRAAGQADHPRPGHPGLGAGLLGALPRAGRARLPGARCRPARAAGSMSWSWRSTSWTPSSTTAKKCCRSTCRTGARSPICRTISSWRRSAYVDARRDRPGRAGAAAAPAAGLVKALGEYQALAAQAAWSGTRREAIQALLANPLCTSLPRDGSALRRDGGGAPGAICRSGSCRMQDSRRERPDNDRLSIAPPWRRRRQHQDDRRRRHR